MTKAFTALTVLKLRDDGRVRLDAPAERLRARAADVAVPDGRLPADPRPRPAEPHRGLRHRRSLGRSPDADARGRLHSAAACRRAVHERATDALRVFKPGLCPARPHHHQRRAAPVRGDDRPNVAATAGDDLVRIRRRAGAARTTRARLPLGRRRVAHRADPRAWCLRCDGWTADKCARLREMGGVSAVGVASAKRRRCRAGEACNGARTRRRARISRASAIGPPAPARQCAASPWRTAWA